MNAMRTWSVIVRFVAALSFLLPIHGCGLFDRYTRSDSDEFRLQFFPDVLAEPISVVSKSETDVVAVMKADKLHLTPVYIADKKYWRARIAGFETRSAVGTPEVPHVTVTVKVPSDSEIQYRIIEQRRSEGMSLDGDLAFESRIPVHNGQELYASRDESAYEKEYGGSPVAIEEVSYSANEKVAVIKFMPLYYSAPRQYAQLTNYLKVHFYFQKTVQPTAVTAPVGGNAFGPLSRYQINTSNVGAASVSAPTQQPIDLIIAAEAHRVALARYISFKRSIGRQVIEKYVQGQSATQIKEIIVEAYRSATPPSTTMLVGHIGQIPSFSGSGDNTWTDWNYTLLDAGNQPDVALGRVPAHSADELNIFIEKAMARETGMRNIDQILLTSGSDMGMRCAENATEVGRAMSRGNNAIKMTHHSKLHGASQATTIEGYNSNPNFIVYDGHGYQQGMSEIPLLIRDLEKLRNTSFPIILDIACLNANWSRGATARNFAESILFSRTGGAAGILASGGSGYGHKFFRDLGKVMADNRNAKGSRGNEIGHVILTAKSSASMEDKTFWNYYGDPASSVWEANHTSSNGPAPAGIFVKLGEANAVSPELFAATISNVESMSYCMGSRPVCDQTSAYMPMVRHSDFNGRKVFKSAQSVNLAPMMQITIQASSPTGTIKQTVVIQSR